MKLFQFFIPPLSPQEKKKNKAHWSFNLEGSRSSAGGDGEAGVESLGEGARSGRGPGPVPTRTQGPPLQVAPLTPPNPRDCGTRRTMTGPWHRGLAKKSSTAPPHNPAKRRPIPRISFGSQLLEGAPLPRSQGRGLRGRRPARPARSGVVYRPHRPTGFVPTPRACLYN